MLERTPQATHLCIVSCDLRRALGAQCATDQDDGAERTAIRTASTGYQAAGTAMAALRAVEEREILASLTKAEMKGRERIQIVDERRVFWNYESLNGIFVGDADDLGRWVPVKDTKKRFLAFTDNGKVERLAGGQDCHR